jgi:hypothetical protein
MSIETSTRETIELHRSDMLSIRARTNLSSLFSRRPVKNMSLIIFNLEPFQDFQILLLERLLVMVFLLILNVSYHMV